MVHLALEKLHLPKAGSTQGKLQEQTVQKPPKGVIRLIYMSIILYLLKRERVKKNSRRGPVLFLSAGGGGSVKCSHGFPGGSLYPVK